jgi:hypothetical protein
MKLYSNDKTQSIDFNVDEKFKKVAVNCSGGADSSILLLMTVDYLMKNNRDDTTVSVLTCSNDFKDRWNGRKAADVINFVIDKTGFKNFDMHYNYYRDVQDVEYFHEVEKKLFDEGRMDVILSGITNNPKGDDTQVEDINGNMVELKKDALPERSDGYQSTFRSRDNQNFYFPFAPVDKKFTASMYDLYGVRDTLLPLTRSCEAVPDPDKPFDPNFEMEPCGTCWWCLERKWAFGIF